LERLESHRPYAEIPAPGTPLEGDLFDALTVIFLEPRYAERARRAVAGAFGEARSEILVAFLAFVRTAHFWTETHPTLAYEADMLAVLATQDELARRLLDETEAQQVKGEEALRRTLVELKESHGERDKIAEALRISEERLMTVLRTARMAFWVWDPESDTVSASESIEALFGLHPGDAVRSSRRSYEHVHPDDLPRHRAKVEAAVRDAGSWHDHFRVVRPRDGKVIWVEEHANATRDPRTGSLSVAGLVWDVSERKLLETSLQGANRKKDEFLATLAHELRNPLASLRNGLQIARLTSKAESPFQRNIEMMDRQVRHLVHLVDDLLDVGRISSGKIELRRKRIGMSEILTSSAEAARPAIDAHGHELIIEPGTEELWLDGDFDRLTQIFCNLLTNAAKYTERGGTIQLRVTPEREWVIVSVTDNGIGIPSADLPHVFELFSQVRLHQGRAEGGLGIGLSVVQKLVQMHGGIVSVASGGAGKGSTFAVRLPIKSAGTRTEEPSAEPLHSTLQRRRILVIDDNRDAADSLATLLQHRGHEVNIAYDGDDGIGKARRLRPDLVFLDLGMPQMNGAEVAAHLRSLPDGKRITLVALTGWGLEQDYRRTREAGFHWHLLKPVDHNELERILAASPM
jgi:PAS domain S-box-containing protein